MKKKIDYTNIDIIELMEIVEDNLPINSHYEMNASRIGNNLRVSCPYHEDKNPSAGIRLNGKSKGVFHCFSCGTSVPLVAYMKEVLGYKEAERLLKDNLMFVNSSFNVNLAYNDNVQKEGNNSFLFYINEYNDYLESRGIPKEIFERFKLGYNKSANTIVFPVFDINGNHLFNQERSVNRHMFLNSANADKTMVVYGLNEVYDNLRNIKELWIVESIIDCLYLWANDIPAVALLGASVSDRQTELLNKLPISNFIIATDNDKAGNTGAVKLFKKLDASKYLKRAVFPGNENDVNEVKDLSTIKKIPIREWLM